MITCHNNMRIEQRPLTVIHADEGKVFRRKSDGMIMGETIHLGYNYYDAGLPVTPYMSKPTDFEEVEAVIPTEDGVQPVERKDPQRLRRMLEIIERERKEFHTYDLTEEEQIQLKELAPIWGKTIKEGDTVDEGMLFTYIPEGAREPKLYKVCKTHIVRPYYHPSTDTEELYQLVTI